MSSRVSPSLESRIISRIPHFSMMRAVWNTAGPQAMNSAIRCASSADSDSLLYLFSKAGNSFISQCSTFNVQRPNDQRAIGAAETERVAEHRVDLSINGLGGEI